MEVYDSLEDLLTAGMKARSIAGRHFKPRCRYQVSVRRSYFNGGKEFVVCLHDFDVRKDACGPCVSARGGECADVFEAFKAECVCKGYLSDDAVMPSLPTAFQNALDASERAELWLMAGWADDMTTAIFCSMHHDLSGGWSLENALANSEEHLQVPTAV